VASRWQQLFKMPVIVSRWLMGESMTNPELTVVSDVINEWRERLYDISWYMRILNEHIAREANREDGVTGRFWEGRFKSQALLDEQAIIACMAYVDLNPVRAGITNTPETSDYTSIQARMKVAPDNGKTSLLPFVDEKGNTNMTLTDKAIPFSRNDYFSLVDWSGRAILANKRGSIPTDTPPILYRLGINEKDWIRHVQSFERQFPTVAGCINNLKKLAQNTNRLWVKGISQGFSPQHG